MKNGNLVNGKKILRTVGSLMVLFSLNLNAQSITLEPLQKNSLYAHGSNYFQFVIAGVPCYLILVIANNGRVEQDSCRLNIELLKVGEASVSFYNVSNYDTLLIKTRRFRVVNIPLPYATLY